MLSTESIWFETSKWTDYPKQWGDISVDVAIIGGGVTGITTAYRLSAEGKKVALLEKDRVVQGESGRTTAHLTEAIDRRYTKLISDFGLEAAKLAAAASRRAIEWIGEQVGAQGIECGFKRLPGYLYTESVEGGEREEELALEYEACRKVGLAVEKDALVPLPFPTRPGVRFADQAQFHPRRFLLPLVRRIALRGGLVFEESPVTQIEEGEPCVLHTPYGTVRAAQIVVATNVPINNRVTMHTKVAAYRSYALAARLEGNAMVSGLFWDTMDPYHYIRSEVFRLDGKPVPLLIVGGEDHKTGTREHTEKCQLMLESYTRQHFPVSSIESQWSGQIIEPVDGLPFIGLNPHSENVFIATGFAGQGMTFGVYSGLLISDLILGRENRTASLFSPSRFKPVASASDYLAENKDFPYYLLKDRLSRDFQPPYSVPVGEGRVVRVGDTPVALYRESDGRLHAFSPVCPHLGCHVHFNSAEKSWDCPCHGSRFDTDGQVLNGPALAGLKRIDLEEAFQKGRRRTGGAPGEAA